MDCEISARNEGRRRLHRRPRGQVNKFPTGAAEERQEKHGPSRGDHRHLIVNQLGRKRRQSIDLTSRPTVFDRYVAAFHETAFAQTLAECDR